MVNKKDVILSKVKSLLVGLGSFLFLCALTILWSYREHWWDDILCDIIWLFAN